MICIYQRSNNYGSKDNFSDLVPSIRFGIVITFHGDLWVVNTYPSIVNFNGIVCYQM